MMLVSILVLGVLVFVHELGHFLIAKWNNVGVIEFAIGFGPRLVARRFGETIYSLRVIPLGGFVRMVGDDPTTLPLETSTPVSDVTSVTADTVVVDDQLTAAAAKPALDPVDARLIADKSRWFLNKPLSARAAVVIAGPLFNLIFAWMLAVGSYYTYGRPEPVDVSKIGDVVRESPGERAGLRPNDRVVAVDGRPVSTWKEMQELISATDGREIVLQIERPTQAAQADGASPPEKVEIRVAGSHELSKNMAIIDGETPKNTVKIGIAASFDHVDVPFGEALYLGSRHIVFLSSVTVQGLWGMIRGAISPNNIRGPLFIFTEVASSAQRGGEHVLSFVIFLSVSLAILNLLPIPVLDGGHLLFFLIEAFKGRPLSIRMLEIANSIGLVFLFLLMAFAIGNDIFHVAT